MKKLVSFLMVFLLLVNTAFSALADRMPVEDRYIVFGNIFVKGVMDEEARLYRGARDDANEIVYIHAYDLAQIIGAEVVRQGTGEMSVLHYSAGNWRVELYTDTGGSHVTYQLKSAYGETVEIPYGRYGLTDCLYKEDDDAFYLPFEQMMYQFAMSWACIAGEVIVYRPETFLDVLAEFDGVISEAPVYEDLMGDDWKEQLANSFGLGIGAAMDELDLQFIIDGALAARLNTSNYQKKSVENAIMLLMMDKPVGDSEVQTKLGAREGFDQISTIVDMLGTALDAYDTDAAVRILKLFGLYADDGLLDQISGFAKPGVPFVSYMLSILQVYVTSARLEESMWDRVEFLERAAQKRVDISDKEMAEFMDRMGFAKEHLSDIEKPKPGMSFTAYLEYVKEVLQTIGLKMSAAKMLSDKALREAATIAWKSMDENDYYRELYKVAGDVRKMYLEDPSKAYGKCMTMDKAIGLVDVTISAIATDVTGGKIDAADEAIEAAASFIAKHAGSGAGATIITGAGSALGFASYAAAIAAFTAGTIDFTVETAKLMNPEFNGILEGAENAHTCLNLIYISELLKEEFLTAFAEIKTGAFTREALETAHISGHLLAVASMHAHEILEGLGEWSPSAEGYKEPEYIERMLNSYPYDKLLIMDEGYVNLELNEPGCVREDIPVSYVRAAVVVMTETEVFEGTRFKGTITRPRVYAQANPMLMAQIDIALNEQYQKAFEGIEKGKVRAANCTDDHAYEHYVNWKLNKAFCSGSLLILNMSSSDDGCGFGHNVHSTTNYMFDVVSGQQIEFEDLFDREKNPQAEADFVDLIGTHLKEAGESRSKAQKVYDEMMKGYIVHWSMSSEGIGISFDRKDIDISCGAITIPYKKLNGIFKPRYIQTEFAGRATVKNAGYAGYEFDEDAEVYENTPAVNVLEVEGGLLHLWVSDDLGREIGSANGKCSCFYAYGLSDSVVTLTEPNYAEYGYNVIWIDEDGFHEEHLPLVE